MFESGTSLPPRPPHSVHTFGHMGADRSLKVVGNGNRAGAGVTEDQIDYLLKTYGPKPEDFDAKALWPMRGKFAFFTAALAALVSDRE
eukprot:1759288-Pyramimonas_sp.AAC.2